MPSATIQGAADARRAEALGARLPPLLVAAERVAATVAQATGATLVELPTMVGGVPEAKDYASFIEYNIRALVKAAGSAPG